MPGLLYVPTRLDAPTAADDARDKSFYTVLIAFYSHGIRRYRRVHLCTQLKGGPFIRVTRFPSLKTDFAPPGQFVSEIYDEIV